MSADPSPSPGDFPPEVDRNAGDDRLVRPAAEQSKKGPWWLYGFEFVFFCFLFYWITLGNERRTPDNSHLIGMGILLLLLFAQFIYEFLKQHAQFGIRT